MWLLDPVVGNDPTHPGTAQPDIAKTFEPTLLTRKTDPNNPARVAAILSEITIGSDGVAQAVAEDPELDAGSDDARRMQLYCLFV